MWLVLERFKGGLEYCVCDILECNVGCAFEHKQCLGSLEHCVK